MDPFKKKSKYSRKKPKIVSNRNGGYGGYGNNGIMDDYKESFKTDKITSNHTISATTNSTSFYGIQTLQNAKRIFGDDKFNLYQHIKELFRHTSTGDVPDLLQYLSISKLQTSDFLSKKVKNQYKEFISMSRNVLEIEDQMSEMDDMLKSMSKSMKSLHETSFKLTNNNGIGIGDSSLNKLNDIIGINEEEQKDRERQEMEVLESMHEQILQHIQLRQLQQATDLIVTAKNEQVNLKQSARKRATNFINNHIHELESLIVDQLSSTSYLPDIKRDKLSTLLMKLGFVDEAMELYLSYKSKSLKQTIRDISLYGDVKQYIQDLSKVFFDEIINSTIKYTNLLNKIKQHKQSETQNANNTSTSLNPFDAAIEEHKEKENNNNNNNNRFKSINAVHMSRLIVWIYAELETYEKLFEQQVFQLEQNDFKTIGECLKIVFKQSTRLDQSGIHVSFLLSNHFKPSIEAAINRLYKKKLESIKKLIPRKENYISKSKNVSNANTNKNIIHIRSRQTKFRIKKKENNNQNNNNNVMNNPFTSSDNTRRRSHARHSRIDNNNTNNGLKNRTGGGVLHNRRSSEIFGQVTEEKEHEDDNKYENKQDTDENMNELRRLTYRRISKTNKDDIKKALTPGNNNNNNIEMKTEEKNNNKQFTVVKLTKSGQEMYEIVKKCIQETWRLLDQRYYSELTKSVYKTVVTQMIYLVQVYSSQITQEINEKAPKQLTQYRKTLLFGGNSSKKKNNNKKRRNSSKNNVGTTINNTNVINTIMEDEINSFNDSNGVDDDSKESSSILSECQMLSLISNVYYVSEDLLTRIAHRYQKLFGRQIPELQLFAIEQQKLYCAQFQQFGKKFLYKWVNNKLLWKNDKIAQIYSFKSDISIITKEEIANWNISKEMLIFVRYIVNLRLEINKYLGANKDIVILRDSIEILLKELYNGNYIPSVNTNDNNIIISPYGLNKLYLDFRFFIITLGNFLTPNSKNLCQSICEKAKKYVNQKYNLKINVDWKLMHSLAMRLQYKALTGDELDVLNKSYLSQNNNTDKKDTKNNTNKPNVSNNNNNNNKRKRSSTSRKNSGSVKNTNNPFNAL